MPVYSIDKLIAETRRLAAEFRRSTGQPLPVSGEIARYDAARLLDLTVCEPQIGGIDATGNGERKNQRIQIKARMMTDEGKSGARIGQINPNGDWDSILLVIMDEEYETCEIYEAKRDDVLRQVSESVNSRRTNRGALSVAKFKNISHLVWTRENGLEGEVWKNR